NTPVFSMKTKLEKSTFVIRSKETVDEPHSMSANPVATASNRLWVSTGTHAIVSLASSCSSREWTTNFAEIDRITVRLPLYIHEGKRLCVSSVRELYNLGFANLL